MKSLLAITFFGVALAPCLWDRDTLATELRGLPKALDMVLGKWHRHSEAYYRERIERLAGKERLTLGECDDLAVAYEHVRDRDKAIAVMAKKAELLAATPNEEHQYRYHANLGTFYAHTGRFDEALVELRNAIAINPDAHFGREIFQVELIEYIAAARKDPELWKRFSFLRHAGYQLNIHVGSGGLVYAPDSSHDWGKDWRGTRKIDLDKAWQGIGGMLRFGGLEGPELYRSLAEWFLAKEHLNLAWWALERAIERGHPAADHLRKGQEGIEAHWKEAGSRAPRAPSRAEIDARRAWADAWVDAFQEAEAAAIARGEDVGSDAALKKLLAIADEARPDDGADGKRDGVAWRTVALWSVVAGAGLLAAILLLQRSRMR